MPNIVLSGIDERLIHGQVGVQWVGFAGANLVLVANDEVAEDPVQQNLMEMVLAWICFGLPLRTRKTMVEVYGAELSGRRLIHSLSIRPRSAIASTS